MEITMENKEFNKNIAYKKAEKRVKEIKTYYYLVIGFLIVGYFLINKNYNGNLADIAKNYTVWMVILWGVFLAGYGIYLFVPFFNNWEERKTKELMNKQLKNK